MFYCMFYFTCDSCFTMALSRPFSGRPLSSPHQILTFPRISHRCINLTYKRRYVCLSVYLSVCMRAMAAYSFPLRTLLKSVVLLL